MKKIKLMTTSLFIFSLSAFNLSAQEKIGFKTPTGNIVCVQWSAGSGIRCDLASVEKVSIPKPKDCDLVWGQAYSLEPRGRVKLGCVGDSISGETELPVLEYGTKWEKDGFTCNSEEKALRCENKDKHGWKLSKQKQSIF